MSTDEEQIRQLVATWMAASKSGDVETVLSLVSDDVVFLMPGREPMLKEEFASQSRAQAGRGGPEIDGDSEIREIQIMDGWAFMWTRLNVTVTPADGAPAIERAGHTLTILKKENGKWLLARDANMLAPKPR
ncbi:YybH family protein [Pseudoduganella namucuonensis]|uniref:DUF4440 domain-containing protein n=1 Tax=Pseudoduganella namucuonensis TaxID=1035707 RepID=A0A1I7M5X7_9BURK|nr:SgcJ/EcaC family oxidoreductase [Pseudoduganella namucuonensis]SFV17359.1 conserved hypothetical protein [Pseudoduganella namucuonensis]